MRVALYARVSTQRQQQSQNIEQQILKLREAVSSNPQWLLSEQHIYLDDGHSGAKLVPVQKRNPLQPLSPQT